MMENGKMTNLLMDKLNILTEIYTKDKLTIDSSDIYKGNMFQDQKSKYIKEIGEIIKNKVRVKFYIMFKDKNIQDL